MRSLPALSLRNCITLTLCAIALVAVLGSGLSPVSGSRGYAADTIDGRTRSAVSIEAALSVVVTSTNDDGPGSLRDAINQANSDGVPSVITFDQGLAGQTIQLQTALPHLNENGTTIDGDINGDCVPDIELNGQLVNDVAINVSSSSNVIRGLIINRFGIVGVVIGGGQNNHVECNYIGTDATGT